MATDTPIPISGPISFTSLKNVFGTKEPGNILKLSDLSKDVMGNVGQPAASTSFAVSVLRNKNLPDPVVSLTPAINIVSQTFEAKDTVVNLNTVFNFRKRIIYKFTLNSSVFTVSRYVKDDGVSLQYSNTSAYQILTSGLNSAVNVPAVVSTQVTAQTTSVPYKIIVFKRNGITKTLVDTTINVLDNVQDRSSTFNIAIQTANNNNTGQHSFNHQPAWTGTHSGTHYQHHYHHHEHYPGAHHRGQHMKTFAHYGNHQGYHHQVGYRPWTQQYQSSVPSIQSSTTFADVNISQVFQLGAQYQGTCASQQTTAQANNNNTCSTGYKLTVKPTWTTTALTSQTATTTQLSHADTLSAHVYQQQQKTP